MGGLSKREVQCAAVKFLLKRANKTNCNFYKAEIPAGWGSGDLRLYLNDQRSSQNSLEIEDSLDNNEYRGISLQWSLMRYMKIFLLNSNRTEDHIEVLTNCIKYNKYTAYSVYNSNYINVICSDTNDNVLLYIRIPHKIVYSS